MRSYSPLSGHGARPSLHPSRAAVPTHGHPRPFSVAPSQLPLPACARAALLHACMVKSEKPSPPYGARAWARLWWLDPQCECRVGAANLVSSSYFPRPRALTLTYPPGAARPLSGLLRRAPSAHPPQCVPLARPGCGDEEQTVFLSGTHESQTGIYAVAAGHGGAT